MVLLIFPVILAIGWAIWLGILWVYNMAAGPLSLPLIPHLGWAALLAMIGMMLLRQIVSAAKK